MSLINIPCYNHSLDGTHKHTVIKLKDIMDKLKAWLILILSVLYIVHASERMSLTSKTLVDPQCVPCFE